MIPPALPPKRVVMCGVAHANSMLWRTTIDFVGCERHARPCASTADAARILSSKGPQALDRAAGRKTERLDVCTESASS